MYFFNRLFILCFILSFSTLGMAQLRNYRKQANAYWNAGQWHQAAITYDKASAHTHPKTPKAIALKALYAFRSAECYRQTRAFGAAAAQYEKAILLKYFDTQPLVYYYLGEMQMAQGEHQKALENFKKYTALDPEHPLALIKIKSCENYSNFNQNTAPISLNPLHKINSSTFDFAPVMPPKGSAMYFSSARKQTVQKETDGSTGAAFTDIFFTPIDRKGNFGEPVAIGFGINTTHSEGAICFDGRGKKMFFTRCEVSDFNLGCDIYMAEKKGQSFSNPIKLNLKDHDSTNVGHPCISPDGKTLIFASNMAGGFGGVDLWISTYDKRNDEWSIPVNMGPSINTAGNDVFPTWGPEDELYYATDGKIGAGGLDIFKAEKDSLENHWSTPVNMGAPYNTFADDYHIIFNKGNYNLGGYLSSNRPGSKQNEGLNSQDIWQFKPKTFTICTLIEVFDYHSRTVLPGVEVEVKGSDGTFFKMITNEKGIIELKTKDDGTPYIKKDQTYTLTVHDIDHQLLGHSDSFSTHDINKSTTFVKQIAVTKIETDIIRLPEIRFEFNSTNLLVNENINSKDSLNYLYELMMAHPNIVIQLNTHSDARGKAEYNDIQSQERAEACVNYLVNEKGIEKSRLIPKGFGEGSPVSVEILDETGQAMTVKLTENYINQFKSDQNKFEYLHGLNRRVEGQIIRFDYTPSQ